MVLFHRVAVFSPLYGVFDYLPAQDVEKIAVGCRVKVPFGHGMRIGIVIGHSTESDFNKDKLRPMICALDELPLLSARDIDFAHFAASYYHHPFGDVLSHFVPPLLRKEQAIPNLSLVAFSLTEKGQAIEASEVRGDKQRVLWRHMLAHTNPQTREMLKAVDASYAPALRAMIKKGFVVEGSLPCYVRTIKQVISPTLNASQGEAVTQITKQLGHFERFLLEGVTGSGKTEVYLSAIEEVIARGGQALLLVPEISLTEQTVKRFEARLGLPVGNLHSGLSEKKRLCAWQALREGHLQVGIGTRSSLFTPMPNLQLILVDEAHDGAYKQHEGFCYNARDLALLRAKQLDCPIVLGSATPALEDYALLDAGQLTHLVLKERAKGASLPSVRTVNLEADTPTEGLSNALLEAMEKHLSQGNQVMLFINQRGFAPVLYCGSCGETVSCPHCEANMTFHNDGRVVCHHCGYGQPKPQSCPSCGQTEPMPLGVGTQKLEAAIEARFPEFTLARLDRDTSQTKTAMSDFRKAVLNRTIDILIGTQMLTKGHDFPDVTLVGIVDVDSGLFSGDFRALEHLSQLITQVSGRAGRAAKKGEVILQTRFPEHPLLVKLLNEGYAAVAKALRIERKQALLPPYQSMILIKVQGKNSQVTRELLQRIQHFIQNLGLAVRCTPPMPAMQAKLAGQYRFQLILSAETRKPLHQVIDLVLSEKAFSKHSQVKLKIDVDPLQF